MLVLYMIWHEARRHDGAADCAELVDRHKNSQQVEVKAAQIEQGAPPDF